MATTTIVHVRVKETIKNDASLALEEMGLTVSDAVRAFLTRIAVEKKIPFTLEVPNKVTRNAMVRARKITKPRFKTVQELFESLEADNEE